MLSFFPSVGITSIANDSRPCVTIRMIEDGCIPAYYLSQNISGLIQQVETLSQCCAQVADEPGMYPLSLQL